MTDADDIKARYDIRAYIRSILGESVRSHRDYDEYCCPFHSENTPSFKVSGSLQVATCFGACGDSGDIFDFVMKYESCDFKAALDRLAGNAPATKYVHKPKERSFKSSLTMTDAHLVHRHFDTGMAYFAQRGITEEVGRQHMLGARIPKPHRYTMADKVTEIMIPSQRFAIPNLFGQHVINIALRRDDAYVLETIKMMDYDQYIKIVRDWEVRHPNKPINDDSDLLDVFGGDKYVGTTGGRNGMFNVGLLYHIDEAGNKVFHSIPTAVWTESEMESMLLSVLGFDSIARNPARDDVSELFQSTTRVVISEHNDGGAGRAHAETKRQAGRFPRGKAQIITPPAPFKGLDDMHEAGEDVTAFLAKHGVYPTRRLS